MEYAGSLGKKKHLPMDIVLMAVSALPVTLFERAEYFSALPEASRRMVHRDPDDVDLLALALHLDVAIWSNDGDFETAGIEWYTTARLLKKLGR